MLSRFKLLILCRIKSTSKHSEKYENHSPQPFVIASFLEDKKEMAILSTWSSESAFPNAEHVLCFGLSNQCREVDADSGQYFNWFFLFFRFKVPLYVWYL